MSNINTEDSKCTVDGGNCGAGGYCSDCKQGGQVEPEVKPVGYFFADEFGNHHQMTDPMCFADGTKLYAEADYERLKTENATLKEKLKNHRSIAQEEELNSFLIKAKDHMISALSVKLKTGDFDSADIQTACLNLSSYLGKSDIPKKTKSSCKP